MTGKIKWLMAIAVFILAIALFPATIVYTAGSCNECFEQRVTQWPHEADIDARRVLMENQRIASLQIDAMYAGFEGGRSNVAMYPDFFGGVYIGADSHAHVLIVESMYESARSHPSFGALLDEGVGYSFIAMSLAQLHEAQSAICDMISLVRAAQPSNIYADNVSGLSSCMFCSKVFVGIVNYNERMIDGFRQYVYDSPMIVFRQTVLLCLGGGQGVIWPTVVLAAVAVVVLTLIVIAVISSIRKNRELKRAAQIAIRECKAKSIFSVLPLVSFMALAMVFASCTASNTPVENISSVPAYFDEYIYANERTAWIQVRAMLNEFERLPIPESHIHIYPDFFGGFYIGYDGRLTLLIVESMYEHARAHASVGALLGEGVRYRFVPHPYNELFAIREAISDVLHERWVPRSQQRWWRNWCRYSNNVTLIWIDYRGYISVGLYQYNENMVAGFRRYISDSPRIEFSQSDGIRINGQGGWIFFFRAGEHPILRLLNGLVFLAAGCIVFFGIRALVRWIRRVIFYSRRDGQPWQ